MPRKDYVCDTCDYVTKDSGNYIRHCRSKRHRKKIEESKSTSENKDFNSGERPPKTERIAQEKVKNHLVCDFCKNKYSRLDNLKRHERRCVKKILMDKDMKLKCNEERIRKQKKKLMQQTEDIQFYKQLLLINGNNKSVSAFNYINKNYDKAEPLEKLTYKIYKCVKDMTYKKNGLTEDEQVVEDVLRAYRQKVLHEEIGDILVEIYKKEKNPEDQSLWSTDPSRLKYVVRRKVSKKVSKWVADKKGEYTSEQLLDPLMISLKSLLIAYNKKFCCSKTDSLSKTTDLSEYVSDENVEYVIDSDTSSEESSTSDGSSTKSNYEEEFDFDKDYDLSDPLDKEVDKDKIKRNGLAILELMTEIDTKKIHKKILRYIAPKFHVIKKAIKNRKKGSVEYLWKDKEHS